MWCWKACCRKYWSVIYLSDRWWRSWRLSWIWFWRVLNCASIFSPFSSSQHIANLQQHMITLEVFIYSINQDWIWLLWIPRIHTIECKLNSMWLKQDGFTCHRPAGWWWTNGARCWCEHWDLPPMHQLDVAMKLLQRLLVPSLPHSTAEDSLAPQGPYSLLPALACLSHNGHQNSNRVSLP